MTVLLKRYQRFSTSYRLKSTVPWLYCKFSYFWDFANTIPSKISSLPLLWSSKFIISFNFPFNFLFAQTLCSLWSPPYQSLVKEHSEQRETSTNNLRLSQVNRPVWLEWGESDYFGIKIREVRWGQVPRGLPGYYKDFVFKYEQNGDQPQGFKHSLAKI